MKNFSTYLLIMFAVLFWIFRIVITIMSQLGLDFMSIVPFNETIEIILLFVFLVCAILIVKRKLIGSLLYIISYGYYFGGDLTNKIGNLINGETLSLADSMTMLFSIVGVILPLAILLDLLLDRGRKAHPVDKKTDWFYKNEEFDRKLDERADKNNYRTL